MTNRAQGLFALPGAGLRRRRWHTACAGPVGSRGAEGRRIERRGRKGSIGLQVQQGSASAQPAAVRRLVSPGGTFAACMTNRGDTVR
jgi:hypothetical protein